MIKSELMKSIGKQMAELPEKQVVEGVNCLLDLMREALAKGQRIEIRGFGSFSLRHRKARNARNPKTGAQVRTGEKETPHFKPGKELRERVNASRRQCPLK